MSAFTQSESQCKADASMPCPSFGDEIVVCVCFSLASCEAVRRLIAKVNISVHVLRAQPFHPSIYTLASMGQGVKEKEVKRWRLYHVLRVLSLSPFTYILASIMQGVQEKEAKRQRL